MWGFVVVTFTIFAAILIGTLHQRTEHFDTDPEYHARMNVMKVFDLVDQRSPTLNEITKYSAFKNEQDIMLALTNDKLNKARVVAHDSVTSEDTVVSRAPNERDDVIQAISNSIGVIEAHISIVKNLIIKM